MVSHQKQNKRTDIIGLTVALVIVILMNYVGSFVFSRFDLTTEKRYSLSDATKELVSELDDNIYIKIYLEGDLPANFLRLRNSIQETLDEIRAYSNGRLDYLFINPSESPEKEVRNAIYQELSDKGIQYSNLRSEDGNIQSEQIIFPGAIFSYQGKEIPLQILKSQLGSSPEVMLNNSIQQLEYEIASSIKKLVRPKRQKIAFLEGHGELDDMHLADIAKTLDEFYTVDRAKLGGQLVSLEEYDAVIIAKPGTIFSEKDKYILDQFIMNGGKTMWLLDHVLASMDSLQKSKNGTSTGIPISLNLEDMLFRYGCRVNTNLVLDLQSLPIPVVTGYEGNQPKQELFAWFYFPLIMDHPKHPIVNNLDALKTEFVNSIDTVGGKGIKKTILLTSSERSKIAATPARISLNMLRYPPDQRQYVKQHIPIAVLLEGKFQSNYKNRLTEEFTSNSKLKYKESGVENKMIVVGDGDIIKNSINEARGTIKPLGYDIYTQRTYGNKDFILNSLNYLLDDSGLIQARSKEFKIRLLNTQKVDAERQKWQLFNTVIPVLLIALFGFIQFFIRRRNYTK
ncbi:MAG: gliding motility-associated ABC transporter substrate-binding protein GldG [Flavobacteriales bacterium]|nr:gliding motility-associated ABC transporter substrate-binding protein GldG [Flavobacteriales bacterium]